MRNSDDPGLHPIDPAPSNPAKVDKVETQRLGAPQDPIPPGASVLKILQARTGTQLGVHLDADAPEGNPVLITPEAKGMRDGSARYQVLGEIGRGGMGVVYKGRDHDLGRDVAMKVLHDDYANQPEVLARFVEEAQIGGQLQHPGIVPVYDMGLQAGARPYFAMKLVKGETLAAVLLRRKGPTDDRRRLLGVFEQVCQTMAYAHSRQVVHRDLKPANIMIGAFGEVQVVDWGLAKVLPKGGVADEKAAVRADTARSVIATVRSRSGAGTDSLVGSMIGTPAYMSPEQALGDLDRLDQRSDVFGLGAILCEILTGAPPYRAVDGDLVRQAAQGALDGAYSRLQACGADEALVALCTECLARAPQARPNGAGELATRISQFLTSVEERARHAELRAAEARYRHRTTLLAAAGGLLLLVLGASAWLWLDGEARTRRDHAMARVAAARSAASGARGQAQAAGLDANLWATALQGAEQVVKLCEDEAVDADTRAAAATLRAAVQQEQQAAAAEAQRLARDVAMRQRLEHLRIPPDHDLRGEVAEANERRRLDADYHRAFADYLGGASLFEQELGTVASSLQSGDIEAELATALDHWGLVRDGLGQATAAPGTARIRALAARLDPEDPWRTKLRSLLPDAATEGTRLLALAAQADFATLTAAGCRVLADALWRADQQDAAVAILRRGQQLHPQDFDLCFGLAVALEKLSEPGIQEAADTYRIAHALRPSQVEVLHRQGMALESLERPADAEPLYRMLVARQPTNGHWLYHLGDALQAQGKRDEAIATFRQALEHDPRHAGAHDGLGRAFLAQGKLDEAIASFQRALEIDPRRMSTMGNLGIALYEQRRFDEAIASYHRMLEIDPRSAHAHSNLGNALRAQGKWDEATASYRRALELDPNFAGTHNNLGVLLHDQGKVAAAIASFRRAIEIDPREADFHTGLGGALRSQGKLDEAIASYRRALEIDARNAPAHNGLGLSFHAQGHLDEAIASFRRALELDPHHADSHNSLGVALADQGKTDEAVASYRRALEANPRYAGAYINLGKGLQLQGRLDEAIAIYHRALAINPRLSLAHNNLAWAFSEQGKTAEAIASLRRALEIWSPQEDPDSVEWTRRTKSGIVRLSNILGSRLREQSRLDEASACLRGAIEIDPGHAPAHYNLGLVLEGLGKRHEALASLRSALEIWARQKDPFSVEWAGRTQQLLEQLSDSQDQLSAVLRGQRAARSAGEFARAVQLGYNEKRYREVVALTEATLADAPDLVGDAEWGTYNSACVAALFAAGAEPTLAAGERARLRGLARTWLLREVAKWQQQLGGSAAMAARARQMLAHALKDPDFASARGPALASLPEDERGPWRELWGALAEAVPTGGR